MQAASLRDRDLIECIKLTSQRPDVVPEAVRPVITETIIDNMLLKMFQLVLPASWFKMKLTL